MLIGLVGKPSVGKSSFFKAATLADVAIANYPFTTIKPNTAIAYVSLPCADADFGVQCNPREGFCLDHTRFVPFQLMDVAGLVPGAYEGKGLGSEFLHDLIAASAFIHIIDISGSVNALGETVPALSYDPLADVAFLEHELDQWYFSIILRGWDKFARQVQMQQQELYKSLFKQMSGIGVTESMAKEICVGKNPNVLTWTQQEIFSLARELRIRAKPMLIAANKIDVPGAQKNLARLRDAYPQYTIIACSAEAEIALREAAKKGLISYVPGSAQFRVISSTLSHAQRQALDFIQKNILDVFGSSGVQQVLNAVVFNLLGYIAIFPGGVNHLVDSQGRCMPDCFLLPSGTTALDFAYKIHQDIGDKFVKAINVKKKLPIGKDVALSHRDVVEIKTS